MDGIALRRKSARLVCVTAQRCSADSRVLPFRDVTAGAYWRELLRHCLVIESTSATKSCDLDSLPVNTGACGWPAVSVRKASDTHTPFIVHSPTAGNSAVQLLWWWWWWWGNIARWELFIDLECFPGCRLFSMTIKGRYVGACSLLAD